MKFPYSPIDLTHALEQSIPTWDGDCGFQHRVRSNYDACPNEVKFRVGEFAMQSGIGTHLDAPAHCIPGASTIDQISLEKLIAPCVVIDVSNHCDENYRVSPQDIKNFEKEFSLILPGTFVMIKTGWERFWEEPEKYRNNHRFPSVSKEAASLLIEKDVCGLGIDTLSPDCPESGFPVHQLFLQSNKLIVENAANLHDLPKIGSFILVIPIKAKEATEAPIRLFALIPTT
ncbi:MAG TPA: cyclase family protein [Gammaproteobacteria bacterium]|nr:cyclase family protein [Gammaproteobacteria bacterium]